MKRRAGGFSEDVTNRRVGSRVYFLSDAGSSELGDLGGRLTFGNRKARRGDPFKGERTTPLQRRATAREN